MPDGLETFFRWDRECNHYRGLTLIKVVGMKTQGLINVINHYKEFNKALKDIPDHFYKAHSYKKYDVVRYNVKKTKPVLYSEYNDIGATLVGYDTDNHTQSIYARFRDGGWVLSEDYYWDYTKASIYLSTRYGNLRNWDIPTILRTDWHNLVNKFPEKFI